jgi:large subunit ribosomal protein L21
MYAIVKVGGKQYRVEKGDSILVDRMPQEEGAEVALEPLLLAGDGNPVFESSDLAKAKVEAVVTSHERGPKVRVLKFKPKKGYKRRTGHRSDLTRLEIGDIKRAARRSSAAAKPEAKAETAEKPAAKPRTAKAPAAKKPAERKPAAKKPAAKKPAARKPAAKKEKEDGS